MRRALRSTMHLARSSFDWLFGVNTLIPFSSVHRHDLYVLVTRDGGSETLV